MEEVTINLTKKYGAKLKAEEKKKNEEEAKAKKKEKDEAQL